jgi:hypothetical protein
MKHGIAMLLSAFVIVAACSDNTPTGPALEPSFAQQSCNPDIEACPAPVDDNNGPPCKQLAAHMPREAWERVCGKNADQGGPNCEMLGQLASQGILPGEVYARLCKRPGK